MTFHVYDGHRTVYETLDEARTAAQAAIDECRRNSTVYEWSGEVSEIAVYEAPDDCGEPWRDGTLVLEARERIVEDEDHPLGRYSEFDLIDVRPTSERDPILVAEYTQSASEAVEVWSSDPALNGTTMIVSTTPEPEPFELVVADLLPDHDDGGEEPGAMYRRALASALASVDLIRQVAIKMSGSGDRADFERANTLFRMSMGGVSSLLERSGFADKEMAERYVRMKCEEFEVALALHQPASRLLDKPSVHGIAIDRVIDSAVGRLDDVQIREAREDLRRLREGRA